MKAGGGPVGEAGPPAEGEGARSSAAAPGPSPSGAGAGAGAGGGAVLAEGAAAGAAADGGAGAAPTASRNPLPRLERLARRLLAAYVLFLVYALLFPFRFDAGLAARLTLTLRLPWPSHVGVPDVTANVALGVPFGALVALGCAGAPGVVLAGLGAGALTYGLEVLQQALPDRVASLADAASNTAGALAGALVVAMARSSGRLERGAVAYARVRAERPVEALALTYAGLLAFVALLPLDFTLDVDQLKASARRAALVPFTGIRPGAKLAEAAIAYAPIAFLLALGRRAGAGASAGIASDGLSAWALGPVTATALAAVSLEVAQLFTRSRFADATEVVGAVLGAGMAVLLARAVARSAAGGPLSASGVRSLVAIWATLLLVRGLAPFELVVPSDLTELLARAELVPFRAYFDRSDITALADVGAELLGGMPLGFLLGLGVGQGQRPSPLRAALVGAGVAAGVELAQALAPGRTPSVTDALLGAAGAWLGARVQVGGRVPDRVVGAAGAIAGSNGPAAPISGLAGAGER